MLLFIRVLLHRYYYNSLLKLGDTAKLGLAFACAMLHFVSFICLMILLTYQHADIHDSRLIDFSHHYPFVIELFKLWLIGDGCYAILIVGTYLYQCMKVHKILDDKDIDQLLANQLFFLTQSKYKWILIVFIFGFLSGVMVSLFMFYLMMVVNFIIEFPRAVFRYIVLIPKKMQEKNKDYLDNNPEVASKILGNQLREALPKSSRSPSNQRL